MEFKDVTTYHTSRFKFLQQAFHSDWVHGGGSPVEVTMLWSTPTIEVWWEYHDGVVDLVKHESTLRLEECIKHRDKAKKMFYVKPNLSQTRCIKHFDIAQSEDITILTCPKWSFYEHVMPYIHENRFELRKHEKHGEIEFLGKAQNYEIEDGVMYDRIGELARAQSFYGDNLKQRLNFAEKTYYSRKLAQAKFSFQPHGVGLRHSVYESMALGTPCIIPECSYIDDITRSCNVIYDGELPIYEGRRKDLEDACVETYETHMTPEKIIECVIKQIKRF